jgi:hypothetical protein
MYKLILQNIKISSEVLIYIILMIFCVNFYNYHLLIFIIVDIIYILLLLIYKLILYIIILYNRFLIFINVSLCINNNYV